LSYTECALVVVPCEIANFRHYKGGLRWKQQVFSQNVGDSLPDNTASQAKR